MTLILNGTDNSATVPAVTGTDTDTGIYYPTSNQVAIATNGTQAMLVDASQNVTFAGYSSLPNTFGFKNRVVNGAMVIDQRNNGGTVSTSTSSIVDNFKVIKDTSSGTFTANQSSTVPSSGFVKSILFTVGTAFTPAAGENNFIKHIIEGYNTADFNFGSSSAATVTLSFWVRSSLTGTFGGSLRNGAGDRSYVFSYTISSANTFEFKTITIPGSTAGSWNTTNGNGFEIAWGLGIGSNFLNTAGAWYSGNYIGATGQTNVTSTAGATVYITGVQLEKGSIATSFDFRPYTTELQLCQRYYQKVSGGINGGAYQFFAVLTFENSTSGFGALALKVTMRTQPTVTYQGPYALSYGTIGTMLNDTNQTGGDVAMVGYNNGSGGASGNATYLRAGNSTSTYIAFSAEL